MDINLNNNNKLYVKGDQAYTCNLQPWITIFSRLYFIMRVALCRHILTWHILHVLCINKYIILWHVKYEMWQCQLRVLTSSVVIKLFAWYLISLGLIPAYDNCLIYSQVLISSNHWFWQLNAIQASHTTYFIALSHWQSFFIL